MKKRAVLCALALLTMLGVISALGSEAAITNEDVVRLTEAGLGSAVIIAKIEASSTDFDTSVDQLVALAGAGVEEDVIAAMVKSVETSPVLPGADPSVSPVPSAPSHPNLRVSAVLFGPWTSLRLLVWGLPHSVVAPRQEPKIPRSYTRIFGYDRTLGPPTVAAAPRAHRSRCPSRRLAGRSIGRGTYSATGCGLVPRVRKWW